MKYPGQVAGIEQAITNGAELPTEAAISLRLNAVETRLEEISRKLGLIETIERAVSDNAERAMSILLLRRDIEGLEQNVASAIVSNQAAIDRLYDMSKWFLGLIATIAIGLLGTGLAGLRRSKD